MLPSLANLSAQAVSRITPWTHASARPAGMRDKAAFTQWCQDPGTRHAFFSGFLGKHPDIRTSRDNPPMHMTALVLDYDSRNGPDLVRSIQDSGVRSMLPSYVSRTFSGNVRTVYLFERPVAVFTHAMAAKFAALVLRRVSASKLFTGLEESAVLDPLHYYELGTEWQRVVGGRPLPYFQLLAWAEPLEKKHDWNGEGVTIPIEALRELGESRFPDRWPGGWSQFGFGARGPRFWDETATNPTGAIVRESGMTYFTDGGGFMSWEDIFGTDTVREWAENRLGRAIADIFYKAPYYWKKTGGVWAPDRLPETRQHLIISRGLDKTEPKDGTASEVDRALEMIRTRNTVTAISPLLFRPDGLVEDAGGRYLNTSVLRPMSPAESLPPTEDMGFPWLNAYLTSAFATENDFWSFLAWLRHYYQGALTQNLSRGLALFLAGGAGCGKTRLSKAVISPLMGRSEDASSFMLGNDKFNDSLFEAPLWTLDDAVPPEGPARRKFGQFLKMVVANDKISRRAMFQSGSEVPWVGRVVITLNDDPESTQIIPDLEENTRDKLMLLKVVAPRFPEGMAANPSDAQIRVELPYFARWLLDAEFPEGFLAPGTRFGVTAYRNPDLEVISARLSDTSSFEDLMMRWRRDYFESLPSTPAWEGNSVDLMTSMHANDALRSVCQGLVRSPSAMGKQLNKLVRKGLPWISCVGGHVYRIQRL